jgi:CheY-like chemotaxis protein
VTQPRFDEQGYSLTDTEQGGTSFAVLNDSPVGEGGNEDLLESTAVAGNLAELILASREAAPFTLAIDAGWGMGKSSLLRALDEILAADDAVSTVWFNAWMAERASAVEGLIKSVLLSFDRNVIRRTVRRALPRAHVLGALRAASLVASSFFGLGQVVDGIWRALSVDAKSRNEIRGVVRSMARTWLDKGDPDLGRRLLVVFIDDLDRCSDQQIFEVCEAIKLYLDVPGIVFVLACDQRVLWQAVGRDGAGSGVRYLEKIIQVNYPIPPPSSALARRLVNGYVARSRTGHLFDESMKNLLIERTGRNPRRIKRLINSFVLEHHLDRAWDELGAENLVKVILLQHFYPEFHSMLISSTEDDPVTKFLQYQGFREFVKHGTDRDPTGWQKLFATTAVRAPEPDASKDELDACLNEVVQELPVGFPELAKDREFVALLESLPTGSEQWRRLLRKPLRSALASSAEPSVFRGMRVLWIDDYPDNNAGPMARLTAGGALVETAIDRDAAVMALRRLQPTVLVSDIGRGEDPQAGFTDLKYLQDHSLYRGPAFFYTGSVTPARLSQAQALGANGITADTSELLNWLTELATQT